MKMIGSNHQCIVAYIAICSFLIHTVIAVQHITETETGKSSNHDAFVTIDNILMDKDDQLSTNSNNDLLNFILNFINENIFQIHV